MFWIIEEIFERFCQLLNSHFVLTKRPGDVQVFLGDCVWTEPDKSMNFFGKLKLGVFFIGKKSFFSTVSRKTEKVLEGGDQREIEEAEND